MHRIAAAFECSWSERIRILESSELEDVSDQGRIVWKRFGQVRSIVCMKLVRLDALTYTSRGEEIGQFVRNSHAREEARLRHDGSST